MKDYPKPTQKNHRKMTPIIPLLILTLLTPQASTLCNKGCATCFLNKCAVCYKRRVIFTNRCSSTISNDNCLLHNYLGNCLTCEMPYAYDITGSQKCVKVVYPTNCQVAQVIDGNVVCSTCINSWPSNDGSECLPASLVQNPIKNCLWGMGSSVQGFKCFRCQDGYVSVNGEKCVSVPSILVGCLTVNKSGKCTFCDVYNGYYQIVQGGCQKRI